MTSAVIVSGKLFRAPEAKKSAAKGTEFTSGVLRVSQGDAVAWWKILAFGPEVRAALGALRAGDTLSVAGQLRAEAFLKDGEPRVGLSVIADAILSARKPKVARSDGKRSPAKHEPAASWQAPVGDRPKINHADQSVPF